MMKYVASYSLIVGVGMFIQWGFFLLAGQVPELQSEPFRIGFHLAGEFVTALLLIFSGLGLLRGWRTAEKLSLVALGMLFYTAIVSPGYFAQKGQWVFVVMFAFLFFLGVACLGVLIGKPERSGM